MNYPNIHLAAIALATAFLIPSAQAAPIYSLTAGTLSYTNGYLGSTEGDSFSFTGSQPVGVQGSGGNNVGYDVLQHLNSPFTITLPLNVDDNGNESGNAQANGLDYGASEYTTTATLTNTTPIVLTPGNLTVSVAAIVSGQINVCTPDMYCPNGSNPGGGPASNPFDASFGPLAGTLTVTYQIFNPGSDRPDYDLTTAVFTTASAPEPSTFVILATGVAALVLVRRSRFRGSVR